MISVIIPTYNEDAHIRETIQWVRKHDVENRIAEIIISDGGSTDRTIEIAQSTGEIVVGCQRKGRSAQMNYGASLAKEPILYFLHADTMPPKEFTQDINKALEKGYSSGCFMLSFDHDHWFLRASCWFTRFNLNAVRFGDQSLFVEKEVFLRSGGFNEGLFMMEDQEIIHRIKNQGKFKVMNNYVVTSARKYLDNGIYRMQGIFFRIWALYYLGYSQEHLLNLHRSLIKKQKL